MPFERATVFGWAVWTVVGLVVGAITFVVLTGMFDRGFLPTLRTTRYVEATPGPAGEWVFVVVGDEADPQRAASSPRGVVFEIQEQSSGRVGHLHSWRAGTCIVSLMSAADGQWHTVGSTTGDRTLDAALVSYVEGKVIPASAVINQWPEVPVVESPRQGLEWWRRQYRIDAGRVTVLAGISAAAAAAFPLFYFARTRVGPGRRRGQGALLGRLR